LKDFSAERGDLLKAEGSCMEGGRGIESLEENFSLPGRGGGGKESYLSKFINEKGGRSCGGRGAAAIKRGRV